MLRDTRVDGRPEVRSLRIGLVAGAFVGVRVAAWALGLRFDASQEPAFWHFIEPQLLEDRLLESLFYLHSQPPLFNLWLGAYHQLFGSWMPAAFGATYAGLGVLLAVVWTALMVLSFPVLRWTGTPPRRALVRGLALVFAPAVSLSRRVRASRARDEIPSPAGSPLRSNRAPAGIRMLPIA